MKRGYKDGTGDAIRAIYCRDPLGPPICEHCDGERSNMVRRDSLRGWVCKYCDLSLDEMFDDRATAVLHAPITVGDSGSGGGFRRILREHESDVDQRSSDGAADGDVPSGDRSGHGV